MRETREDSFCGDSLYDRIVPRNHFLRQAEAVVPWQEYGAQLLQYYKGGTEYIRPPWNPVFMEGVERSWRNWSGHDIIAASHFRRIQPCPVAFGRP